MKKFFNLIFPILLIILLIGCVANGKEEIKWFKSEKEAIKYGLKYEEIKESDVLEIINLDKEKLVVFKFSTTEGKGINIANIVNKNKKYSWNNYMNRVIIKSNKSNVGTVNVVTELKTSNNQLYKVYLGNSGDSKDLVSDIGEEEGITPNVDESTGMYYAIKKIE